MTIKDLIKKKDYDYISIRLRIPKYFDKEDIFFGACESKDGELYPLDGDSYDVNAEVIKYKEWSKEEVENGLTVVIEGDVLKEN